jgi:hypothetical protein
MQIVLIYLMMAEVCSQIILYDVSIQVNELTEPYNNNKKFWEELPTFLR